MSVNIHLLARFLVLFLLVGTGGLLQAQEKIITILKDNDSPFINQIESELKEEINNLLIARYSVNFISYSGADDSDAIENYLDKAYREAEADLVIAIGVESSTIMHNRTDFPLPSIATMVMEKPSGIQSAISNYTYATPYKSLGETVRYFADLFDINTIGVVGASFLQESGFDLGTQEVALMPISMEDNSFPEEMQGCLLTPQSFAREGDAEAFIQRANEQGLPTFSLTDAYLDFGWTAGIKDDDIINPLIKKTALNALYIFEGRNAAELSIHQNTHPFQIILNMKGIRTIRKIPEWSFFENAILVNVAQAVDATPLSLNEAIALGLRDKVSLKKAALRVEKAVQEVKQSQGLLTPNLSVGAQSLWLSNNLVEASLGQKGEMTISGNLNLEQVLFSEPALANIAIKKLLKENTDEQERQTLLDDVVNITHSYISVLLAKANLILQNENLNVTKQNLVIAESKEQLGLSKQSDVNRWLSELNINQIQLSTAQANFKKAVYTLNETLNQPINTAYTFPDSIDIQATLKFPEDLLTPYLKDEFLIETLADFYISEMKEDAPELLQLQFSEQILKRKIQSEKRQFYLPKLVGFASANDIFVLEGLQANPQLPVPPPPQDLTWNAGIGVRFPLLDNRTRKTNLELTKLDEQLLEFSKQEVEYALEKGIRSQVQQFSLSYLSFDYANKAAAAARANYAQAEDAYRQGFISITQLLDAQSAKFNTRLLQLQTQYKMVLDYLLLERLSGKIQLLDNEQAQLDYINQMQQFLLNNNNGR